MKIVSTKNAVRFFWRTLLCGWTMAGLATTLLGQEDVSRLDVFTRIQLHEPIRSGQSTTAQSSLVPSGIPQPETRSIATPVPVSKQQPKRILGIMPNYRAVSAGAIPPPPTFKQSFKIATQNSFDYSSFVFVGITSAIAYGQDTHKQLGDSASAFWRYYWRGFVDKTNGNYLVIWALPAVFRQDERYYALGKGSIGKRALYAASRVLITPDYHGHNSFNASELLGRAVAQGISTTYYPSADTTLGALATRWGYAIMRDSLTNVFREFWPDSATHALHRHP
ncbi:MAG: hypothetical protein ACJ746_16330 [Bryobacteraceae bacterium]